MKKRNHKNLYLAIILLLVFILWTVSVSLIDRKAIGPQGSIVGFAKMNLFFHSLTGVNMALYTITDWLGLVPIGFALGFALLGLFQWIKRRDIKKVDRSILFLGVFYILVLAVFILFENIVINYRPILIEGVLEASYPSSTTMLVMCIIPTSMMQLNSRIQNKALKHTICLLLTVFTLFMVIARLLSGVHWFTDIVGGTLVSAGLILLYRFFEN